VTANKTLIVSIYKELVRPSFRQTIQDRSPWNRIVVIIFRTATTSAPTTILGEVEVKKRASDRGPR
jgi:hypothetical protein